MSTEERRGMLPEDLYRITFVEDAQISPSGYAVAFVRKWLDAESDDYRSTIWLTPVDGGEPAQFTAGPRQDSSPRWSPDGRWLAFLSNRDTDKSQIWLLPSGGGEARQLTDRSEAIEQLAWSPDGTRVAFTTRVPQESGGRAEVEAKKPRNAGARIVTSLKYKSNGVGFIHDRRRHIFVLTVDGDDCRQLTDGDFDDADPAWSPDGAVIAFSSARHPGHELDSASDIFTVPASGGLPHRVTETRGPAHAPAFSGDGQRIAYLGHDDPHAGGSRNTTVWIVPAQGGTAANLMAGDDRTINADIPPVWSPDGSEIFVTLVERGAVGVARVAVPPSGEGNDGGLRATSIAGGRRSVGSWSLSANGRCLAFTASTPVQPAELYVCEPGKDGGSSSRTERKCTDFNRDWLAEVNLSAPESFTYQGADGWKIEGWLMRPAGFELDHTYPLLLNIHGGPHMYYGWGFFDESQVQAGAGYAVLYVNPRGSQGYGEGFARACCRDWGGRDFEDVMAGVEYALGRFAFLDAQRLGVLGGSYGGFLTSWIVGHSTRFKAAVSERAVNSLVSLFGTSDIGYYFEEFEVGGTPLDSAEFYAERSPLTYAGNVQTPLLIVHSENDLRCPIEQAEQFYTAIKLQARAEVAFVRFPEETHELSRSGKPSRRVERFAIILDWFDRYLQQGTPARVRSEALASALASGRQSA